MIQAAPEELADRIGESLEQRRSEARTRQQLATVRRAGRWRALVAGCLKTMARLLARTAEILEVERLEEQATGA
ncbi:hypothetical protein [Oceanithermus sp.]